MTAANRSDWTGFEGIDPSALRALAESCAGLSTALHGDASMINATAAQSMPAARVFGAARRVMHVADDLRGWSGELLVRADTIEAGQRRAGAVLGAALSSAVASTTALAREVSADLAMVADELAAIRAGVDRNRRGGGVDADDLRAMAATFGKLPAAERRAVLAALGVPSVFRWVDEILLESSASFTDGDRIASLALIVESLEIGDLIVLVDALMGAGHELSSAAAIGDVVAPSDVGRLIAALGRRLDERDLTAGVLAGHALSRAAAPRRAAIFADVVASPGRLSFILWAASIEDGNGAMAPMDRSLASLAEVAAADLLARVVVELIIHSDDVDGAAWGETLDQAIASLILTDPSGVVRRLRTTCDRSGEAVVLWFRRLVIRANGPAHLGELVDGLVGASSVDPEWFGNPGVGSGYANARDAGYVCGALVAAIRLEALEGRTTVANLDVAAGLAEGLMAIGSTINPVIAAVLSGSFIAGTDAASRRADQQIDQAMWSLLGRIDERFVPSDQRETTDLGRALLAFDASRDAMVRAWVP